MAQLVDGKLDEGARQQIEAHVDGCAACRRLLAEFARNANPNHGGPAILTTAVGGDASTAPIDDDQVAAHRRALNTLLNKLVPTPLARGESVGRYLIVDVVGRGGMGIVYSAYDPELDRKVALKLLLADSARSDNLRHRLRREAQAMARLSHSNVVTVYDVGIHDDQLFIAMELMEGATLVHWLQAEPRKVSEVLEQFAAAGRGLEAVHAAGFVHRDFKPANVLVGRDGRVCVSDFGLARLVAHSGDSASSPDLVQAKAATLTEGGTLLGTPSYMAPEQLEGKPADARSDQFAFCVALYEALYGERPFAGKTVAELRQAVRNGQVREPALDSTAPPRVRQILLRGLQTDPAKRYESMTALLRDLGRDPARRRRRAAVVGAALLATFIFGVVATRATQQPHFDCHAGDHRLNGIWDPTTKTAIHSAFGRTGRPYAEDAWRAVERNLDSFAGAWTRSYTEACETVHVRGEQSAELLDLRMDCLNHRLDQVAALTVLLAKADAPLLEKAASAVQESSDLSSCADVPALRSRQPPPSEPARRAAYDALDGHIAQLQALKAAGRNSDLRKAVDPVVDEARRVDHPVLLSDALRLLGESHIVLGEFKDTELPLHQAAAFAERGGDDGRVALAWDDLALVAGDTGHGEEGKRWLEYAAAAGQRAGHDLIRQALHLRAAGQIATNFDRAGEAAATLTDSAAAYHQAGAPLLEAASLVAAGFSFIADSQIDKAVERCQRALELFEGLLGPKHPLLGGVLSCLSASAIEGRRLPEAVRLGRRAVAIYEDSDQQIGAPAAAAAWSTLAQASIELEDFQGGLAALDKAESYGSTGSPWNEHLLQYQRGEALLGLGRASAALPRLEAAYQWMAKEGGDKQTQAAWGLPLAKALLALGKERARAIDLARQAETEFTKAPPIPSNEAIRQEAAAWLRAHGVE
jgi:tRNA A-37 threonylcarbamoyl transferase component Bud32